MNHSLFVEPIDLKQYLLDIEKNLILRALAVTKTKAAAARLLCLHRPSLVEKMRRFGMPLNTPNLPRVRHCQDVVPDTTCTFQGNAQDSEKI